MWRRREFLGAMTAVAVGCGTGPRRPNILLLMPDQWRGLDLAIMGNADVRTPHMDQLAADGALLVNTIANCPVCCPSRGTLLTGRYAHQHGVDVNDAPLPNDAVSIAEIVKEQGYRTGFVGKWHLEGGKRQPGFVEPGPRRQGFDFWAANICSHDYWNMSFFRDTPDPIQIQGYSARAFTDEAIGFIEAEPETPFLLYLQWGPPHNPYVAPPEYMNQYEPDGLAMRPNWEQDVRLGSRDDIAGYYAAITFLDDEVGRIVETLKRTEQFEDTIILITSDHGDMLGSHGTYLKRKPWDESIRVPGIVHYPRAVAAGQEYRFPLAHVDMPPTLLGLAGIAPGSEMVGHDASPALRGEPLEGWPESAYIESYTETEQGQFAAWRGVRTERYTYARFQDEPWLLYDNEADPYQQTNLVGQAEQAALQEKLDAMTMAWFKETGDSWRVRADLPYR